MKTFLLLMGVGLALANQLGGKADKARQKQEFVINKQYPEVITEFETVDYAKLPYDQLIKLASEHQGLEFLSDVNATASMGIDIMNLHPDLVADAISTTYELVRRRGYPAEVHRLQTRDGYILEMHRIPGSQSNPPKKGKRVVFLQHGLLDSSSTWVIMGPESGLGYILADLGYDVWLGNARGNRYSRKHIKHDPDGRRGDRRRFWDFSWHQIGTIDLPAMIDHITNVTGQERMHYAGHSQGTTAFFVMCSEQPTYNKRIISAHMLAPIAFMGRLFSPFVRIAALAQNSIDFGASVLGIYEFLPNSDTMTRLGQAACRDQAFFQTMCTSVLFLIAGFNSQQTNGTMLPVILGHTPAGASTDQLIHYAQGIRSNRFRLFNFGAISNLISYGSLSPPHYNLANIHAPTTLYYSLNDWLADERDVRQLFTSMTGRHSLIQIEDRRFNHLDFVWAIDVKTLLYDKVVQKMREHEKMENL